MGVADDSPEKSHRPHKWAWLAERLRANPVVEEFVSCESQGWANPFTLASTVRGALLREGLIVSIDTSFPDNGIYVALVRDLRKNKPS